MRIAVSAIVLGIIFHVVPFAQVWAAAKRLTPQLWLAGFALFLLGHAMTAAKWWMLIGHDVRFSHAFRAHLAGLGANLALPGVAGGDVVRAALVMGETKDKGRLAVGSLVDRLIDTASLALVSLVGAWFAFNTDGRTTGLVGHEHRALELRGSGSFEVEATFDARGRRFGILRPTVRTEHAQPPSGFAARRTSGPARSTVFRAAKGQRDWGGSLLMMVSFHKENEAPNS